MKWSVKHVDLITTVVDVDMARSSLRDHDHDHDLRRGRCHSGRGGRGPEAESKADIEMTPLLFAGVRWLPVNCGRQVRTGLGITSLVGVAVYGFIHAINGVIGGFVA